MNTMTLTLTTFDTLEFAKRLEAAGVESKIAEVHSELQAEFQEKIFEALAEYKPILDELKVTKHELATKSDLNKLEVQLDKMDARLDKMDARLDKMEARLDKMDARLDKMEGKIDCLRNELIFKLGGVIVASVSVMGTIIALILHH